MIAKWGPDFKKVTDPKEIEFIRKRELDSARMSGKEMFMLFCQLMDIDVDIDEIFSLD